MISDLPWFLPSAATNWCLSALVDVLKIHTHEKNSTCCFCRIVLSYYHCPGSACALPLANWKNFYFVKEMDRCCLAGQKFPLWNCRPITGSGQSFCRYAYMVLRRQQKTILSTAVTNCWIAPGTGGSTIYTVIGSVVQPNAKRLATPSQ